MKGVQDKWLDVNIPSEGYRSHVERHAKYLEGDPLGSAGHQSAADHRL